MRKFAPIPISIWQDQKLKRQDRSITLLYIYLRSSPQSNMLYLYSFSDVLICDDLSISKETLVEQMEFLEQNGYIRYDWDNRIVWVVKAMVLDMPTLKKNDCKVSGIQKLLDSLEYNNIKGFLIDEFKEQYSEIYHLNYTGWRRKKHDKT